MPRSFLIRKVHPKIDSEQGETTNGRISIGKATAISEGPTNTEYQTVNSSSNYHDEGLEIMPTVDHTVVVPSIGAMTEVNTTLKGTFQCEHCCRSFNRASDLKRHQLAHTENKPYICYLCDRQFTWLGNFQKHCASHVQAPPSRFSFFAGTPLNVLRTSPSSIFYEGTSFNSAAVYLGNTPRPQFHCEYNRAALQPSLTCNVCCLTFTTSRALKMHTRIHTGEKPYKCLQCSKAFARKDELHTHKYFHTGEKPYKCDKCSASFVRFGHLQRHKFVHYDVKPYQCKLCPKSFTQYRNLQTHMYKHTGERPFKCKYCPKGFTQYGTLQAHERTHTGERPFMCNICNRRFITSSHLRWHVRTQH